MVWITIGILLVLLVMMPIRLLIAYSLNGVSVRLKIGLLTFSILPRKTKAKQKEKVKSDKPSATGDKTGEKAQKTEIKSYLPILRTVLDLLVRLRRKAVMKQFDLLLILAGDDPSDLAILYGRTQGVFAVLLGQIEDAFRIQNRNVRIECDFTAEKTVLDGFVDISISLGKLLLLAAKYGTMILREYFAILNNKKAVQ